MNQIKLRPIKFLKIETEKSCYRRGKNLDYLKRIMLIDMMYIFVHRVTYVSFARLCIHTHVYKFVGKRSFRRKRITITIAHASSLTERKKSCSNAKKDSRTMCCNVNKYITCIFMYTGYPSPNYFLLKREVEYYVVFFLYFSLDGKLKKKLPRVRIFVV